MTNENSRNKHKREKKKKERLKKFIGIDLCACVGGHKLECCGPCRLAHTPPHSNHVVCSECYQIGREVLHNKDKKPKRSWKYGRQNDTDNRQVDKQIRRNKMNRDKN